MCIQQDCHVLGSPSLYYVVKVLLCKKPGWWYSSPPLFPLQGSQSCSFCCPVFENSLYIFVQLFSLWLEELLWDHLFQQGQKQRWGNQFQLLLVFLTVIFKWLLKKQTKSLIDNYFVILEVTFIIANRVMRFKIQKV